jgi:hypothetical protein
VVVNAALPAQGQSSALLSWPEVLALAARSRVFESVGGVWARPAVLRGDARETRENQT